jgi:hypothetical protein
MRTAFGKQPSGLRRERLQGCERYRDGAFHNVHPILDGLKGGAPMPSIGDFLCGGGRRVPTAPLATRDPRSAWSRAPETGLRVTWLGHSTLLVELDGVRVLTDPVWGERVSPVGFAGPKRFPTEPGRVDLPKPWWRGAESASQDPAELGLLPPAAESPPLADAVPWPLD